MARKKSIASSDELERMAEKMRIIFQEMLKNFVTDKHEKEQLARVLGKTPSLVNKMLYKGLGGLDVWVKALAYYYKLNDHNLQGLRSDLRRLKPIQDSDKIWFSIKEKMGASEEDLFFLAQCAREAFRIKSEIEELKKKG